MKRGLFLVSLLILPLLANAVPVEREVGNGLLYYRVHKLPDDLPGKTAGRVAPTIVDVRYVNADANAAAALFTWLRNRATSRSPVFVVANSDSSPALLKVISGNPRGSGIVVVGIARGAFRPDVAVKGSAEDERRAYDALEKGGLLSTLLTDNPDKVRNDEASLSKDRLAEASADAAIDAGKKESPLIDVALQRAVHLHRALVALKKI